MGTLPPPHALEGHSPHGAHAAAVQLQLVEVGQVNPCAPQERQVGDRALHPPSPLCTLVSAPGPLRRHGCPEP